MKANAVVYKSLLTIINDKKKQFNVDNLKL